jgi:Protein of unknown function (DUF2934)
MFFPWYATMMLAVESSHLIGLRLAEMAFGRSEACGEVLLMVSEKVAAVGSDKLKEEWAAQELKGNVHRAAGDAKAAVKDWKNKAAAAADDLQSKIRERAYRIWQQEGSPEGRAQDHWHQAEREIDAEEASRKM